MEKNKSLKVGLISIISWVIVVVLAVTNIITYNFYRNNKIETIQVLDRYEISISEFKEFCDTNNIATYDAEEYGMLVNGAKKGYIHGADSSYKINYWNLIDENNAWYVYYGEILKIEKDNIGQITENSFTNGNFSKYTAISNGLYKVIIKVGNSLLWAEIDSNNKADLDMMLEKIGY